MFTYLNPKKRKAWFFWTNNCNKSCFIIILFIAVTIVSGCISTPSKQQYENPVSGISLEKPNNWDLIYIERNGTIILESKNKIRNDDLTRIEIHGIACNHSLLFPSEEHVEANIDRLSILYGLDTIRVIQEPIEVNNGDYKVTKATIDLPRMSLAENEVEDQNPNTFQKVDLFDIRTNDNNYIMAYIYQGNSEELNEQAQEIVDSIKFICTVEP